MRRLILLAATIGLLLTTAMPVVAAPGPRTLVVDDDGAGRANNCNAGASAYDSIQDAIDEANPGDTILVCPGAYREFLEIHTSDLTIRSIEPWAAKIHQPAADEGPSSLVEITADRVTLQHFRIAPRTQGVCYSLWSAIEIEDAADVVIRANRITPTGTQTRGDCAFAHGLDVDGAETSVTITNNIIRDFGGGEETAGIFVHDDAVATITSNSIQYRHASYDSESDDGAGIAIYGGASAVIRNNNIYSGDPNDNLDLGYETPWLAFGIDVFEADEIVIANNWIYRASESGVWIDSTDGAMVAKNELERVYNAIELDDSSQVMVRGNRIVDTSTGIDIEVSSENTIKNNTIEDAEVGIEVEEGSDLNLLRNNRAHGYVYSCIDVGIDNDWIGNIGDGEDTPDGICPPEV